MECSRSKSSKNPTIIFIHLSSILGRLKDLVAPRIISERSWQGLVGPLSSQQSFWFLRVALRLPPSLWRRSAPHQGPEVIRPAPLKTFAETAMVSVCRSHPNTYFIFKKIKCVLSAITKELKGKLILWFLCSVFEGGMGEWSGREWLFEDLYKNSKVQSFLVRTWANILPRVFLGVGGKAVLL